MPVASYKNIVSFIAVDGEKLTTVTAKGASNMM